jgi:3-oxoacyl-[acyl-carrier-protein] synthase-3
MGTQDFSAGIASTGMYVPPKIVTNKDMESMVETSDAWITEKTGIKARRFVEGDKALSDICIPAARQAIRMAGILGKDVDTIIVGAISHDYQGIPTANILKKALGAKDAYTLDINVICSGFVQSLDLACKLVREGSHKNVLVLNGEVFSRYKHSRLTSVIFGDGAGAFIVRRMKKGKGLLSTYLKSDVTNATKLAMLGGGSRYPATTQNINKGLFTIQMDGKAIFDFATKAFPEAIIGAAKKAGVDVSDIDMVISHQANIRIIKEGMKQIGLPMSKTYTNIHKYGNIGGGSITVALHEALKKGLIRRNDLVATVAFGAGLSWGANIMRWCDKRDVIK